MQQMKLPPREVKRLFFPYWSLRNRQAIVVLVILVAVLLSGSAFNAWITHFTRDSYNAIEKRDFALFKVAVTQSMMAFALSAALFTFDTWLKQWVEFNWRKSLTDVFASRWLAGNTFYRLERQQRTDNPDQRIAEDVRLFTEQTVGLGFSFITNLGLLSSFGYLLWTVAGSVTIAGVTIHGYMFWVAIGFGLSNTGITHWAGRRLSTIRMNQQRVEGDFRFALSQQREYAEQIAFYDGGPVELGRLRHLFSHIAANWGQVMRQTLKLNFVHLNVNSYSSLVPILVISPKLFSGELTLGEMMQNNMAYGATVMAVSWFANSYGSLVSWSAITRRLIGLNAALDEQEQRGIALAEAKQPVLKARELQMALPDGAPLADIGALRFEPGGRWLIKGASGAGKSTLLRTLAGLWPYGRGSVELPPRGSMMFVPQKSYIPAGTLKEALCYPKSVDQFSDEACRRALVACRLPQLVGELHDSARWAHRLSGGEQQRLAFARVLLARPGFIFLDEATSALDNPTEAALYTALGEQLGEAAVISVAHRATLEKYHDQALELAQGRAATRPLAASAC
ncbi:ABC transporter ATP-binding protein/permease [Pelomonas sp. KK5]|uniref:ABC transporter ATP-binding protein/permease n=1 Tax=Pelomonas sp. KK5 TaxID=1855730 RepID=UPI0009F827EE|nr:ABC transporter ATP-binding protein/permease [Pelomonas sp. KK5]